MLDWFLLRGLSSATSDGAAFDSRGSSFGATVDAAGTGCFVVARPGSDVPTPYLAVNSRSGAPLTPSAERLLEAKADESSGPELPTQQLMRLRARPSLDRSNETAAGKSPLEMAHLLKTQMPVGTWLAVPFRAPSKAERNRCREWWTPRRGGNIGTHYAARQESVLVSFYAGSDGAPVDSLLRQVAGELAGFDLEVEAAPIPGRAKGALQFGAATVVAALGAWGVTFTSLSTWWWTLAALAGLAAVVVGLRLAGVIPSERDAVMKALRAGQCLPVPKRSTPPRKPRKATTRTEKGSDGIDRKVEVAATPGDYPLAPGVFLATGSMSAAIAYPHYGAGSQVAVREDVVSAPLLSTSIGPEIGVDAQHRSVCLDAASMFEGVFVSGRPGSGKSEFIRTVVRFLSMERMSPSGRPGWPGANNAVFVLESKGDTEGHLSWLEATGDSCVLSVLGDQSTPAIDILPEGTPEQRAAFMTDLLIFAWGDKSVGLESKSTLRPVFTLAMRCLKDDAVRSGLPSIPDDPSFVWFAGILLGSRSGDRDEGIQLYEAISARCAQMKLDRDPEAVALEDALRSLGKVYGSGATMTDWKNFVKAPQNKVAELMQSEFWWTPSRPRASWAQALNENWFVLLDLKPRRGVPTTIATLLSRLLMRTLRLAIEANCEGWQDQGRQVTIVDDECAETDIPDPDGATDWAWFKMKGRAFGVVIVAATQMLDQLSKPTFDALSGCETTVWFQQIANAVADAVRVVTSGGFNWSSAEFEAMPKFTALFKTIVAGQRQSPVLISTRYVPPSERRRFVDKLRKEGKW